MVRPRPTTASAFAGLFLLVLRPAAPAIAPSPFLEAFDPEGEAVRRLRLPDGLEEVSGLATDARGRLFAHDDERARIWQIDPLTGEPVKAFTLGDGALRGDFEGIAVLGDRFFLVSSRGTLVEFREGEPGERRPYRATPTALAERCEVEGLAADAAGGRLLAACKAVAEADADRVVVYALDPDRPEAEPGIVVSLPFAALRPLGLDALHPSGVEILPDGGLLLVSARERALVEIAPSGQPVAALRLRRSRHPQPEGIAVDRTGALLVADEGGGGRPRLTRIPPSPAGGRPPGIR